MCNTSFAMQRWFLFFALPSSFFSHAKQQDDLRALGLRCSTPTAMTTVQLTAVAANWTLNFSVKAVWAGFPLSAHPGGGSEQNNQEQEEKDEPVLTHCEMGLQVGDVVQSDISWDNFPAGVVRTAIGRVTARSIHKCAEDQLSQDPPSDRVDRLDLLVTHVPRTNEQFTNLETILRHATAHFRKPITWAPSTKSLAALLPGAEHFRTYLHHCLSAITSGWIRLANSSLPVEWHELFNLADNVLLLLYSSQLTQEEEATDSRTQPGASAPQPNLAWQELCVGQDRVDLTPSCFLLRCTFMQLQPAWAENNFANFTFEAVVQQLDMHPRNNISFSPHSQTLSTRNPHHATQCSSHLELQAALGLHFLLSAHASLNTWLWPSLITTRSP